ncbi:MAG: endonuclease/exonuclease/phosphatase family protein [Pseudomonadota bacterium]
MYLSELFWSGLRHSLPASASPWIIGGDFNTSEFIGSTRKQNETNRTGIARLHDLGLIEVVRHANGGPAPSWLSARPSANLKHQLDHLYVSDALMPRLRSAEVRPEIEFATRFSDHLPIVADCAGRGGPPSGDRRPRSEITLSSQIGDEGPQVARARTIGRD